MIFVAGRGPEANDSDRRIDELRQDYHGDDKGVPVDGSFPAKPNDHYCD